MKMLQKIIDYGLLLTLIVFPLSINIALSPPLDQNHPVLSVNFSLADLLIGLTLILWLVKTTLLKEWSHIKFPPLPVLFFVGAVAISFVNSTNLIGWAKETIQMAEYFLLYFLLLFNNLKFIKKEVVVSAFLLSTSLVLIFAFIQYAFIGADSLLICGLFENRNLLGVFLCLVTPIIYAKFLDTNKIWIKVWMVCLLIISLIVLLSASAILAILFSLAITSWIWRKKVFFQYASSIVILGLIYVVIIPEKNISAYEEFISFYERGSIRENYYNRLTMIKSPGTINILNEPIDDLVLRVSTNNFFLSHLPAVQLGDRYREMEEEKHIKNRYLEMQAALHLISKNTLFGVGAGNYQDHIGIYFYDMPKVNTAEPHQNNTYLVFASSTGILGLASLIWVLSSSCKRLLERIKNEKKGYLEFGLLGSLIAISIEGFFSMILSSEMLVPLVFILFLSNHDKSQN